MRLDSFWGDMGGIPPLPPHRVIAERDLPVPPWWPFRAVRSLCHVVTCACGREFGAIYGAVPPHPNMAAQARGVALNRFYDHLEGR